MDIKTLRFKEMEAISQCLLKETEYLEAILERYQFLDGSVLNGYVLGFLKNKAKEKPVRAYLTWKLQEYLLHGSGIFPKDFKTALEEHPLFSARLPLVFELIITIQYFHNQILDEKFEARTGNWPKVNSTLIKSNLLRELLHIYLDERVYPLLSLEQREILARTIRQLLIYVDLGQRLEKEYNTYTAWKSESLPVLSEEKFLDSAENRALMQPFLEEVQQELDFGHAFSKIYFHRIYLTNVFFFQAIAQVISTLLPQGRIADQRAVQNFALLYGFMLQLINDYADYAYSDDKKEQKILRTAAKKSTDFMADLYNFNVTLPLIFHLQWRYRRRIEAYLEGGRKQKRQLSLYARQIMEEIVQSGGIRKTIALSRKIAQAAVSHLDKDNPAFPYLENMGDMASDNKFYDIFIPKP